MVLLVAIALCGAYALWGRHFFSAKLAAARRGLLDEEEATTTATHALPKYRDTDTLKVNPSMSYVILPLERPMQPSGIVS